MTIIDSLITYRTEADVERLMELAPIAWDDMTYAQKQAWLHGSSDVYWSDGERMIRINCDL